MKILTISTFCILVFSISTFSQSSTICDNLYCNYTDSLNLSTGIDTNGNLINDLDLPKIDPFWKLVNVAPPSVNGTNSVNIPDAWDIKSPSNAAYWNNISGAHIMSVINTHEFDTNNTDTLQPWRFRRTFCICQESDISFDYNFNADDGGKVILKNVTGSFVQTIIDLPPNASTDHSNFDHDHMGNLTINLASGQYFIEVELINKSHQYMGFALNCMASTLNDQEILTNPSDSCCSNGTISVKKILDNDCNGAYDNSIDQLGNNWTFLLHDSNSNLVGTQTTNQWGEATFSGLLPGNYTVLEQQQSGWSSGSSQTVILEKDEGKLVTFFNCPQLPENCCDSISINVDCCSVMIQTACDLDSLKAFINSDPNVKVIQNTGGLYNGIMYFYPASYGVISNILFEFVFENGEVCEKLINMDNCYPCCDSITIDDYTTDPDLGTCCLLLKSDCQTDSVLVSVVGGVLDYANSNCGPNFPAADLYRGLESFTFASDNCAIELVNCFEADPGSSGDMKVYYTVYMSNGEVCPDSAMIKCPPVSSCCDSTNIFIEQLFSPDGHCCAKIETFCDVDYLDVSVTNGTFHFAQWDCCGPIPSGYQNTSSYTFNVGGQPIDLRTRINTTLSGIPIIHYTVYMSNGEICNDSIIMDCNHIQDCCPVVGFNPRFYDPNLLNLHLEFNIANVDPLNPICYIQISSDPPGNFTKGNLLVDNGSISQNWNVSRIPESGSLNPPAFNSVIFDIGANYQGTIYLNIIRSDSSVCYYEFNWNKNPVITPGDLTFNPIIPNENLFAVQISPVLKHESEIPIKYLLIGLSDQNEIKEDSLELFAASSKNLHSSLRFHSSPENSNGGHLGVGIEYFDVISTDRLGTLNLVFTEKLPKLYCVLINEEGNIVAFEKDIELDEGTSTLELNNNKSEEIEIMNLYPNPSNGTFKVTFAVGKLCDVNLNFINSLGEVLEISQIKKVTPGIHNVNVNIQNFAPGIYNVVLSSGNTIRSKSAIIK